MKEGEPTINPEEGDRVADVGQAEEMAYVEKPARDKIEIFAKVAKMTGLSEAVTKEVLIGLGVELTEAQRRSEETGVIYDVVRRDVDRTIARAVYRGEYPIKLDRDPEYNGMAKSMIEERLARIPGFNIKFHPGMENNPSSATVTFNQQEFLKGQEVEEI
ncbi:MAG: hypothetical protein CEN88_83 [Candidatus Berkelbacteria bacterium Licking1014_2]|uniref:Uncharacterized protein n=1 Tax=Candidatus Berkelbacteria bacterium Licking1014_2 TaxID=2017146 RepID=A0A554LWT6_9BACT|nr:MAG: hypothetical protein CEN88_83 [Candidatus Berkelbacteria bacterium Licking1014_2]